MINPLVKTLTRAIITGTNEIFDIGTIKNKVAEGIGDLQKDLPELADNDTATYALSVAEEIARTGKENSTIFDEAMDPEQKIAAGVARFVNKTLEDLPDFRLSKEEEAIDIELDEDEQPLIDYFDALFKDYYGKNYTDEGRRRMATAVAKASKEIEDYEDYLRPNIPGKTPPDEIESVLNREEALEDFLAGSVEDKPVYRAVDFLPDMDYDTRFLIANEGGVHAGTEGQATFRSLLSLFKRQHETIFPYLSSNIDTIYKIDGETDQIFNKNISKKDLTRILDLHSKVRELGWNPSKSDVDYENLENILQALGVSLEEANYILSLGAADEVAPTTINKGYINVQNPLEMGMEEATWFIDGLFGDEEFLTPDAAIVKYARAISDDTGYSIEEILDPQDEAINELQDLIESINDEDFNRSIYNRSSIVTKALIDVKKGIATKKFQEWLESYGYDSVRYINNIEPSYPDETAFSYILFRPEQFKSVFAKQFDPEDPRFGAAEGGLIGRFFENFMARNQEIKQEDTRRVVKQGDTLSKIAKEAGLTVEELQEYNKIKDKNKIQAGQSLRTQPPVEKNQVMANVGSFLNPFAGDKTAEDYDSAVVEEIRKAAKNAIAAGRMNIDYEDYEGADVRGQASSPEKREETSFVRRMLTGQATPTEEAAFSVGGATLVVEDDNVYATDVYDFSSIPREKVKDTYSAIRYIVGEIPGNEFKSKIYLGKADEFGIRKGKAEGGEARKDMYRRDGSRKSAQGFLGPVKNKVTNKTMTELSIDVPFDGKEVQIPTMVPTLTAEEIKILQSQDWEGKAKDLPRSIVTKAVDHARKRMAQGLNPFYQDGEEREAKAKGGKVSKKDMACNKPKRTPQHPKKSHVVKACEGGKEKVIRFGEQGAETAGKPKAGESARMKKKRKSFKARHAKNIKKGKMSAAYWADKVKW